MSSRGTVDLVILKYGTFEREREVVVKGNDGIPRRLS